MKKLDYIKLPTMNKGGQDSFIVAVNKDIDRLNILIADYISAKDSEKKGILLEIYHYQKAITDKYPDMFIASNPSFQEIFHKKLFESMRAAFEEQQVDSMNESQINELEIEEIPPPNQVAYVNFLNKNKEALNYFLGENHQRPVFELVKTLITKLNSEDNPERRYNDLIQMKALIRTIIAEENLSFKEKKSLRDLILSINHDMGSLPITDPVIDEYNHKAAINFANLIGKMQPESLQLLEKILYEQGKKIKATMLDDEALKSDLKLFEHCSISYLGGSNSNNFLIKHEETGEEFVLKVENRMNAPNSLDTYLRESSLRNILPPVFLHRQITFSAPTVSPSTLNLIVTPYFREGNLKEHRDHLSKAEGDSASSKAIISSAAEIFAKKAEFLLGLEAEQMALLDDKNSNWSLDEKGQPILLDTKSLKPTVNGDVFAIPPKEGKLRWFKETHTTPVFHPPELTSSMGGDADKMHAFMLGKNLYQYLTGCDEKYLGDRDDVKTFDVSLNPKGSLLGKSDMEDRTLYFHLDKGELNCLCTDNFPYGAAKIKLSSNSQFTEPLSLEQLQNHWPEIIKILSEHVTESGKKNFNYIPRVRVLEFNQPLFAIDKPIGKMGYYAVGLNSKGNELKPEEMDYQKIYFHLEADNTLSYSLKHKYGVKAGRVEGISLQQPLNEEQLNNAHDQIYQALTKDHSVNQLLKIDDPHYRREDSLIERSGRQMKAIIEALVREKPADRISVAQAYKALNEIRYSLNPEAKKEYDADLKKHCQILLDQISLHRITSKDKVMDDFINEQRKKLGNASTETLIALRSNLEEHLSHLKSPVMNEVKTAIQKTVVGLRNDAKKTFAFGKNAKADKIEEEFGKVPLAARSTILKPEAVNAVKKAMEPVGAHQAAFISFKNKFKSMISTKSQEKHEANKSNKNNLTMS